MASLYKQTTTKIDKQTGKKVRSKSRKWYGQYRNANGKTKRVPLCRDKSAAQSLLNDLVRTANRKQAGLIDQYDEHLENRIDIHLEDFRQSLLEKNSSPRHITQTCNRLALIVSECGFRTLADLAGSSVTNWLLQKRKSKAFGIKTSNYYLSVVKQFGSWLVQNRRLPENPFQHLKNLNAQVEDNRSRRTLTKIEFGQLLEVASKGKTFRGLSGYDRAVLYLVAVNTGFRANELSSLKYKNLNLDSNTPTITVEAAYSKRRREDIQPIRTDLAHVLKVWIQSNENPISEDTQLWSETWSERAAKMLKQDLEAADIFYEDESGRVFDFHALRHQFISNLAESGVHPKIAQQLARHSTITLTMDRYTHSHEEKIVEALNLLPPVTTNDETEKFTLLFTLKDVFSCPEVSSAVSDDETTCSKKKHPTP
ncbi:hypothetical protein MNBD_PLANCTO02-816 [hydrothermal vent metagenome]|uniref:Tyr recombinase domain-containing protein n=1 Tax=hydrothermal vent metagenome TaxID=652676 RepID=A0A3B1DN34_9ZZZZ